jgi:integrase
MPRHACEYKLANDGQDTRAVQHYLGHKNIQPTVRYTELPPEPHGRVSAFQKDPGVPGSFVVCARHGH